MLLNEGNNWHRIQYNWQKTNKQTSHCNDVIKTTRVKLSSNHLLHGRLFETKTKTKLALFKLVQHSIQVCSLALALAL